MRKIEKNFTPLAIVSEKIEKEFQKNLIAKKHVGNDGYKIVREDLVKLYHNKCAYCEKDLADTDKPVEHYRPKSERKEVDNKQVSNGYYWLAYSWCNLILACTQCNRSKSTYFDLLSTSKPVYSGESFKELQYKNFDNSELPFLINPEQIAENELNEQFYFEINGSIVGKTPRMKYTIKVCDLNRTELQQTKRFGLLSLYINRYNQRLFKEPKNKKRILESIIEELERETNEKSEFTVWRKFVINYFREIYKRQK